jgi:hypothetical protein
MEKLEQMEKIADLYLAKDKHGRTYFASKYDGKKVYYVFKNDYQNSNNADYFLYAKNLFVKKKSRRTGKRPIVYPKSKIKTRY